MTFVLTFVVVLAACVLLREPLRRYPAVFYTLAVVAVVAQLASAPLGLPKSVDLALLLLVKRCNVAMALFAVVMFIGVLSPDSRAGSWMRPVRSEISIVACILCAGHVVGYVAWYVPRVFAGALANPFVAVGLVAALVLTVLLVLLGVTSVQRVKRAMGSVKWRRIQRLAYLFFVLACVHALLMLMPSALGGGATAVEGALAYGVLLVAYLVLRGVRLLADRRLGKAPEETRPLDEPNRRPAQAPAVESSEECKEDVS